MTPLLPPRPDWHRDALCTGATDLFFPKLGASTRHIEYCKAICAQCPVQTECLDTAMSMPNDLYGIFGGKTPRERRAMRAERGRGAA